MLFFAWFFWCPLSYNFINAYLRLFLLVNLSWVDAIEILITKTMYFHLPYMWFFIVKTQVICCWGAVGVLIYNFYYDKFLTPLQSFERAALRFAVSAFSIMLLSMTLAFLCCYFVNCFQSDCLATDTRGKRS